MRILYLVVVLLTIGSCKGQDKNKQTVQSKQEKTMKTFDIDTFEKNKQNAHEYFYINKDSTVIKQYKKDSGYSEKLKAKGALIEIFNSYYENGKLEYTVKRYSNFIMGIMKEYDEQGNLIKETDLDKHFTYTWEDVKKYLQEHDVKDFEKDIIGIERYNNSQGTTWGLVFEGKYKKLTGQFRIKLDGKTGEELLVELFKGKGADGEDGTIAVYDTIYIKK